MIYKLHYGKLTHEFIELDENSFKDIQLACITSEFQKISLDSIEVFTSDELGGMDFPEFYYDNAVPLFSKKIYEKMKKNGIDNIFVKSVTITDNMQEKSKEYILTLPPRINVLSSNGKIDESKVGNFKMFKIADSNDNNIYVTEDFINIFNDKIPLGMEILQTDV